jgi:hypothetical protein
MTIASRLLPITIFFDKPFLKVSFFINHHKSTGLFKDILTCSKNAVLFPLASMYKQVGNMSNQFN